MQNLRKEEKPKKKGFWGKLWKGIKKVGTTAYGIAKPMINGYIKDLGGVGGIVKGGI